jgi:hypothetical protein
VCAAESRARAGHDGARRRKEPDVDITIDMLGHLLALTVTSTDQDDSDKAASPPSEFNRSPAR